MTTDNIKAIHNGLLFLFKRHTSFVIYHQVVILTGTRPLPVLHWKWSGEVYKKVRHCEEVRLSNLYCLQFLQERLLRRLKKPSRNDDSSRASKR